MGAPTYVTIPDILASWPWQRTLNPLYEEVKEECDAWIANFKCFTPKAQKAYDACAFNLLGALTWPEADREHLTLGCHVLNILNLYDEFTDCCDDDSVRNLSAITMDAFRNPDKPRPAGEVVLGEAARQFWKRATATLRPDTQARFIEIYDRYTASVIEEAQDRFSTEVRSIDDYMKLRRVTAGVEPCLAVIEFGLNIPPHVFEHPVIKQLNGWTVDLVFLSNDIYSFSVERARGDPHNLIHFLMAELSVDINGAIRWIAGKYIDTTAKFLSVYRAGLPSFGSPEVDAEVLKYVEGMAKWARGVDAWSFESKRYFGNEGPEVYKTRRAKLLPGRERVEKGGVLISGLDIMEKHDSSC